MAATRAPLTLGMAARIAFHGRRYPEYEGRGATPPLWETAAEAMAAAAQGGPAASDDGEAARAGYAAFSGAAPPAGRLTQDAQWRRAVRAERSFPG